MNPPTGGVFQPRGSKAMPVCSQFEPRCAREPGKRATRACHLYDDTFIKLMDTVKEAGV
jgi:hypothetical protein